MSIQRLASLAATGAALAAIAACSTPVYNSGTAYPQSVPAASNPAAYAQYGTVANVEFLRTNQSATGGVAGAVVGGVVGGALGNQVGGGDGKKAATVAGVIGGALIGRAIEQNTGVGATQRDVYRVSVRLDDGNVRSFDYMEQPNVRVGDRVRLDGNQLYR